MLGHGNVLVFVYKKDTHPNDPNIKDKIMVNKVIQKGTGFGELALLYNDKRSATVQADTNCKTYVLDGNIFKTIVIQSSIQKRSTQAGLLDKI